MKIVIEHENSGILIVLPTDCAAAAALLLANAAIYRHDDYPRHQNLVQSDTGLLMRFDASDRFTPASEALLKAQAKATESDGRWMKEYRAREESERKLAEATAALAALQAITVCHVVEPEAAVAADEAETEVEEQE